MDGVMESDYLSTLLRDSNASHVLETIVSRCPADAFNVIWKTYFEGKLARLAIHPVANFVVARALERVSEDQLLKALEELQGSWRKFIRLFLEKLFGGKLLMFFVSETTRTGVLRAVVDRIPALNTWKPHIIADVSDLSIG